ncbi:MAG: dihydroneopterin aldolase [Candidatus Latescibacterota bacterium]
MDAIRILGLKFTVTHGVHPEEKTRPQSFEVDVEIFRDLKKPASSDRIEDTVDYSQIVSSVQKVMEGETCNLLERLAGKIVDALRPIVGECRLIVRIRKPNAPLQISFDTVEVEVQCEI